MLVEHFFRWLYSGIFILKIKKYVLVIVFFLIAGSTLGVFASVGAYGNAYDSVKPIILISTIALIYFRFRVTNTMRVVPSHSFLLYVIYGQVFFISASIFFPLFFSDVGEIVGLAVSEKHEGILARTGWAEGNRAMSVFGNPNVAAKVLVLTYAFEIWLSKASKKMMGLVLLALLLTGSRAGLLIYLIITFSAYFSRGQLLSLSKYFCLVTLIVVPLLFYSDMSHGPVSRIINFSLEDNSLVYKLKMMSQILDADKAALFSGSALDNDLIYTTVHFNGWYLIFLFASVLVLLIVTRRSYINFIFLYSLSGSLLYSSVNVGVLICIYIILIFYSMYGGMSRTKGGLAPDYAFK